MKEFYSEKIKNGEQNTIVEEEYSESNKIIRKSFEKLQSCYHENSEVKSSHRTYESSKQSTLSGSPNKKSSLEVRDIFANATFNHESSESDDGNGDDEYYHGSSSCSEAESKGNKDEKNALSKESFFSTYCSSLSLANNYQKDTIFNLAKDRSIFQLIILDECFSTWNGYTNAPKISLRQRVATELNGHKNQSIRLRFGRICFNCHKLMLRKAEYFRETDLQVYSFKKQNDRITAIGFHLFYRFAMGEHPPIPAKYLLDVRHVAQILRIPDLESYCMQLLDSDIYQENEAFEILKCAKAYNVPVIQRLMVQRVFKYFLPLVGSKDFLEMDVNDVCNLLESETIGVNSEIEVFFAAILWLNWKWKERGLSYLTKVISCVRFAMMPPWFIYTLKNGTGVLEVDRVITDKNVLKFIDNGASLAATVSLFLMDNSKFEYIVNRLQRKIPQQRHWIYDKKCTYHFGAHEKVSEAVDFQVFTNYLQMLQMEGRNYWCEFREGKSDHFVNIFCQPFLEKTWSKVHL